MRFTRKKVYWFCQVSGWFLFVLLNILLNGLQQALTWQVTFSAFYTFFFGIAFSHLYRSIILKYNWLRLSLINIFARFLLSSLLLGFFYHILQQGLFGLLYQRTFNFTTTDINQILNISVVFVVWSLIYFLVHFIENYKKEEIKNLKWEAAKSEFELNKLKSQLNPHFMFNSMNSIRALVDENPAKAKAAVTQLANILRTSLQISREKLISFEEELSLTKDYLNIESIRYEERLRWNLDVDPASYQYKIPPLMLQTMVENAIKHGISKLVEGGTVEVSSRVKNNKLHISIINSGIYDKEKATDSGLGIKNTIQRLELIYGNSAAFNIQNTSDKKVAAEIIIPHADENNNS